MDDVIAKLTPGQALAIVERLARKGGPIGDAVIAEALDVLADVDIAATAEQVLDALDSIDVEKCWARSGRSRHGYTSPDEAAAEIAEEELQPYIDQVERYHQLGMHEQEAAYCIALILGLYRYDRESGSEFKAWAVDVPGECAALVMAGWRRRNGEAARLAAMRRLVRRHCPDWAGWLDGPGP